MRAVGKKSYLFVINQNNQELISAALGDEKLSEERPRIQYWGGGLTGWAGHLPGMWVTWF